MAVPQMIRSVAQWATVPSIYRNSKVINYNPSKTTSQSCPHCMLCQGSAPLLSRVRAPKANCRLSLIVCPRASTCSDGLGPLLWLLCGFSLFRKAGPLLCFLFHWTGNLNLLFCWIYYIGFRPTVLWYSGRIFTHNLLILVSSPMNTGFVGGVSLSSSKACAR